MLASNLLNTVAPASMPRVCSTEGRINFSLHTDSFIIVKSTQMRTSPAFFSTTTILAHHHSDSPPSFSIRSISSFTFPISGRGTLCDVWREKGTDSGFNLVWPHGVWPLNKTQASTQLRILLFQRFHGDAVNPAHKLKLFYGRPFQQCSVQVFHDISRFRTE